ARPPPQPLPEGGARPHGVDDGVRDGADRRGPGRRPPARARPGRPGPAPRRRRVVNAGGPIPAGPARMVSSPSPAKGEGTRGRNPGQRPQPPLTGTFAPVT